MSKQLLNKWRSHIEEEDFLILKEFVECLEQGKTFRENLTFFDIGNGKEIFNKGSKKILCFKGKGNKKLLTEIIKLIGTDKIIHCNEYSGPIHTWGINLVIFDEYNQKIDPLLKQLSSGDEIVTRRKKYENKANILYLTDNDENMDDILNRRVITINVNN